MANAWRRAYLADGGLPASEWMRCAMTVWLFPQAELVEALPILRAVRVERAHPCDFVRFSDRCDWTQRFCSVAILPSAVINSSVQAGVKRGVMIERTKRAAAALAGITARFADGP